MKKALLTLILGTLLPSFCLAQSTEFTWQESPTVAQTLAVESNKGLFIEFTGSDWCGACQLQDKHGLSQPDIQAIISKHFIPIRLDFLQKQQMPTARLEEIKHYENKFKIRAYPTIVIADAQERPVYFIFGYGSPKQLKNDLNKGVQAYLDYVDLRKKFEKAKSKKSKAEHLASLLRKIPSQHLMTFYKADYDELLKLDPKDETCFKIELEHQNLVKAQQKLLQDELTANRKLFQSPETLTSALQFLETYTQKDGLLPETHQELLLFKARLLIKHKLPAEAKAPLEDAIKLQPNSPLAKTCNSLLKNLPFIIEKLTKPATSSTSPIKQ